MKVLLVPLLSFALLHTGLSQLSPPDNLDKSESESVDAATDKAVRGFFKQLEKAYNNHKSHRIASFFAARTRSKSTSKTSTLNIGTSGTRS